MGGGVWGGEGEGVEKGERKKGKRRREGRGKGEKGVFANSGMEGEGWMSGDVTMGFYCGVVPDNVIAPDSYIIANFTTWLECTIV